MKKLAELAVAVALGFGAVGATTADESATPKSRAEVTAELLAAIKSGELAGMNGEDSGSFYLSHKAGRNTFSRRQVMAEVVAARRDGNLDWLTGEDSGSFVLSGTPAAAGRLYAGPNPGDAAGDGATRATRAASAK